MNKLALVGMALCTFMMACESRYPMDKPFWTTEDYRTVWLALENTPDDEQLPRLSDPETAPVFQKIVDPRNYEAVLEDTELGLTYRSKMSGEFFDRFKYILELYSAMDVQDQYIYPEEFATFKNFFLGFQVAYFRVGNESIASRTGDSTTIRMNERTVISNFTSHLEELRREKSYDVHATKLADGISIHFAKLLETFPTADYSSMLTEAKEAQKVVQTPEIKTALAGLISKIESKAK